MSGLRTVAFAYHNMGVVGLEALRRHGFETACVFSHEDDPEEHCWFKSVREWCERHGVRCELRERIDMAGVIATIEGPSPDFIFSFYYRRLLPQRILDLASKGALNLHGSLLPKYRGRAPVNWAIINGERETGVTLHHMVAEADAGDIVGRRAVPIREDDTALSVYGKLAVAASGLLDECLPLLAQGCAPRYAQDGAQATTFGRRRPEDGAIDWNRPVQEIRDLVRAVTKPYPGAFTWIGGSKLTIWQGHRANLPPGEPGSVSCRDGQFRISAKDDWFVPENATWEGVEQDHETLLVSTRQHDGGVARVGQSGILGPVRTDVREACPQVVC